MRSITRSTRGVLIAVLAVTALTAVTASAASAAVKDEWMVNKTALASGQSDSFTAAVKAGSQFKFKFKESGIAIEFVSSKIKLPNDRIMGGKPGIGSGSLTFENTTVVKPTKCILTTGGTAGVLAFNDMKMTVVEGASGGIGNGKALVLLQPNTGSAFTTFEIKGGECAANAIVNLEGSILMEGLQSEASPQTMTVLPSGSQYIPSGGKASTAGLTVWAEKEPVVFSGVSEWKLASEAPFAAL